MSSRFAKPFIFLASLLAMLCVFVVASPDASAIQGASSNWFPDVDEGGSGGVSAVVQIVSTNESNWATKMKAQTTLASVYVPASRLNQNISLSVIDGCDGRVGTSTTPSSLSTPRDSTGWQGTTVFSVGAFANTTDSAECNSTNADLSLTFTATAGISTKQIIDTDGTHYYVYQFTAQAAGLETGTLSARYLNAFKVQANTPGVYMGVSTDPGLCDNGSYPRSCPETSLLPPYGRPSGPSYVYSSFYGATDPSSMSVNLTIGCTGGKGQIYIYDLDGEDATLGQNLTMTIQRNGVDVPPFPLGHSAVIFIGGQNNQAIHAPGINATYPDGLYTFDANAQYTLKITGVSNDNALQILPFFMPNASAPGCGGSPPIVSVSASCGAGGALSFTVTASDPDGDALSVSTTSTGSGVGTVSGTGNKSATVPPDGTEYKLTSTVTAGGDTRSAETPYTCPRPIDHAPSLSDITQCATPPTYTVTIRVDSHDSDGDGSYQVQYSWDGSNYSSVSRNTDGYFYINAGTRGMTSASHIWLRVYGVVPAYAIAVPAVTSDRAFGPCYRDVTGTVYNAYNHNTKYGNLTINSCVTGVSDTTASDGTFSFRVLNNSQYCVRLGILPSGGAAKNVRPWGYGAANNDYRAGACVYNSTPDPMGYCSYDEYINQYAGSLNDSGGYNTYDRASDGGFDFVVRFRPRATCSLTSAGYVEVGTTYIPVVRVTNTGNSNLPPIDSGDVQISRNGGAYGDTHTFAPPVLAYNSSPNYRDVSMSGIVYSSPTDIVLQARINVTGDGLSTHLAPQPCGPIPVACLTGDPACDLCEVGIDPGCTTPGCPESDPDCTEVPVSWANKSYMKFYGSDVWAGGNYDNGSGNCTPPTGQGGIYGWAENEQEYNARQTPVISGGSANAFHGASSQLSITSLLEVNEFFSASNRVYGSGNTFPPKGLTFANNTGDRYGVGFGSAGKCVLDYYGATQDDAITEASTTFPPAAGGGTPTLILGRMTVDYVTMPSNGDPVNVSVKSGSRYRLTVSGTYSFGSSGAAVADARCASADGVTWVDNYNATPHVLELFMNGAFVNWDKNGAPSPTPNTPANATCASNIGGNNHTYVYEFTATTNNLAFSLFDSNYTDNTGSLSMSLAEISRISSITANSTTPQGGMNAPTVIDGLVNRWNYGEWASSGGLAGGATCSSGCPYVQINFNGTQPLGRIALYDRNNPSDHVLSGRVELSNGTSTNFGPLRDTDGSPIFVTYATQQNVTWARVVLTSSSSTTANIGLAEVVPYFVIGTTDVSAIAPYGRSQYHLSGNQTIGGITIPNGVQTAVYVNGDVFINNDIVYDNASRANTSDIPFFSIIACGSIRIGKDVHRIDGLYIAQATSGECTRSGAAGTVFTCAKTINSLYSQTELYDNCQSQLAINGALVAKTVKWQRAFGTLKDSVFSTALPGEVPDFNIGYGGSTKAAEIVNYTPEMFLAPSPLKAQRDTDNSIQSGRYDAITSLPPVF